MIDSYISINENQCLYKKDFMMFLNIFINVSRETFNGLFLILLDDWL